MNTKRQVMLVVLDGWGYRKETEHNAIAEAKKPFFDSLWQEYPHSLLEASGEAVGLPEGQMGNSEVGHTAIGAGKIVEGDLLRINKAVGRGEFGTNPEFLRLFEHVKKNGSTLHVMGLIGPGGVHSHMDHLYAFLRAAKILGVRKIAIHAFTDGRDTPPKSASGYIGELEHYLDDLGVGEIATVTGRYYAMDRDNNWDRVKKAEHALFEGKGEICNGKPSFCLENKYGEGKSDEHFEPIIFSECKNGIIGKNDGVFFFNFRPDRARMLASKVAERAARENICFVTLTQYDENIHCGIAFPPQNIKVTLGSVIADAGLAQAHIAETEKYAHVTYFFNGGREQPYSGETDVLVPSHKDVKTHDQAPEMRAAEIAEKVLESIKKGEDFILVNFANADMVGHTGNESAAVKAIEAVDAALAKIIPALLARGGVAVITADHGNAEMNIDPETGTMHTAHTTNPVPVIVTEKGVKLASGGLSDIAPTVLKLLDLEQPPEMTGKSLV